MFGEVIAPNESKGSKKRGVSRWVKEASAEVIGPHDLAYRLPRPGIRSCHRCSPVYHAPRTHARTTYARTHARTLRKRTKILSKGSPRVYIWLSHSLAHDFYYPASRRRLPTARRKPSRTSKIRDRGALEWYRQCILSRCPPSWGPRRVLAGRRPRQRVHTKSRTRPTLQRQRVYRRRPAVWTKCTSPMRLMAILFYAWRLGARQKSFAREPDYLLLGDVCQPCGPLAFEAFDFPPSRCRKSLNFA